MLADAQLEEVKTKPRPGGALIYFVIWDIIAFLLGWLVTLPFLLAEIEGGGIRSMSDAIADWRFRCALYFCKVVIGGLSFPFLIFAIPIMQVWLTHVRPTGYDKGGNCVPKLSAAQIKAKFRHQYKQRKKMEAEGRVPREAQECSEACGEACWDRVMNVDPYYDDVADEEGNPELARKSGAKLSIVEEARRVRQKQLRRERLPEASLLPLAHANNERHGRKLMVQGDPTMFML